MTIITTRLTVAPDGTITADTPLPAGDHVAQIALAAPEGQARSRAPSSVLDLPVHDGPWDGRTSLRREELYDARRVP